MPKKHRAARHAARAQAAEELAAKEQVLPPPPDFITELGGFAQATEGVREQQLGMFAQQTFEQEQKNEQEKAALQARIDEFEAQQKKYETAYGRSGAETNEERGAVLSRERWIKGGIVAVIALMAWRAYA